jgi:hypothetical protein
LLLRDFRHFSVPLLTGIAMVRFLSNVGALWRLGRWGCAAVMVACLGLSGCAHKCNLRGDNFTDNALADQARAYRTPDKNNELSGWSNRAQQIEKDVGVK